MRTKVPSTKLRTCLLEYKHPERPVEIKQPAVYGQIGGWRCADVLRIISTFLHFKDHPNARAALGDISEWIVPRRYLYFMYTDRDRCLDICAEYINAPINYGWWPFGKRKRGLKVMHFREEYVGNAIVYHRLSTKRVGGVDYKSIKEKVLRSIRNDLFDWSLYNPHDKYIIYEALSGGNIEIWYNAASCVIGEEAAFDMIKQNIIELQLDEDGELRRCLPKILYDRIRPMIAKKKLYLLVGYVRML